MRFSWLVVLLLSTGPLLAEEPPTTAATQSPATAPAAETPAPPQSSADEQLTETELKRHIYKVNLCLREYDAIQNKISVRVTIGGEGMIEPHFDVLEAIDSDQYRQDLKTALKRVHQCEPFIIEPVSKTRGKRFNQIFNFPAKPFDADVLKGINDYLDCVPSRETGPDVVVDLKFNPDGTFAEPAHMVDPVDTPDYREAAATIIDQLNKCLPAKLPAEKFLQWQTLKRSFLSRARIAEIQKPAVTQPESDKKPSDPAKP